jgi:hypothetical protein
MPKKNQIHFTYHAPLRPIAHSIWTHPTMAPVQLAPSTEYDLMFGIAYFSEVWFRFTDGTLFSHCLKGKPDPMATMERRGN